MNKEELLELEESIENITKKAKEFGLDYYDMRFEICPAEIIYTFGAYGMPTRFSHWSFGKNFHKMKTQYDYNLSRIYELVINSDPCYAFLLDGNTLIQNKMVIAHVFAHCDFFKNNAYFGHTNRSMVDSMAISAERIRQYEFEYGREKVENLLNQVLSIQEHIDHNFRTKEQTMAQTTLQKPPETKYDDIWSLDKTDSPLENEQKKRFPPNPEKDLLWFIINNSKELEPWQKDVVSIIRDEMIYFWPQLETKIMNEGWASLWHARIMREIDLSVDESIEFAKLHSGVLQPSKTYLNPYYVGMKIWEDIEKRWDNPSPEEIERFGRVGGEGKAKIFEVRETDNDISFIRNYLTEQLVEELDLYLYKKVGHQWQIVEKNWEKVRDEIVAGMTNGGNPYLVVEDGDYNKNGELYIRHCYEGIELDIKYLEKTIPDVYSLWGRPVHLETTIDGKNVLFSYNGERNSKRILID